MKNLSKYFLLLGLSLVFCFDGWGQHTFSCGTHEPSEADIEKIQAFVRNFQSNSKNLRPSAETVYIPLKIHVVLNDAGTLTSNGFFESKRLNQALASTNLLYQKANIQFFKIGRAHV